MSKARNSPKNKSKNVETENKGLAVTKHKIFNAKNSGTWIWVDSTKKGTSSRKLGAAKKLWKTDDSIIFVPEHRVGGKRKDVEEALKKFGSLSDMEVIDSENCEDNEVYKKEIADTENHTRENRIISDLLFLNNQNVKDLVMVEAEVIPTEGKKKGPTLAEKYKSMGEDQYLDVSNIAKGAPRMVKKIAKGKHEVERIVSDNTRAFEIALQEIYGNEDKKELLAAFRQAMNPKKEKKVEQVEKVEKKPRNPPKDRSKEVEKVETVTKKKIKDVPK